MSERAPPAFLCPLEPAFPICGVFSTSFLVFQLSGKGLNGTSDVDYLWGSSGVDTNAVQFIIRPDHNYG